MRRAVLATPHTTPETCNGWLFVGGFATFGKADYGWLVSVPDNEPPDLSNDLRLCFALALMLDCDWWVFDCDAELIEGLPTYPW